MVCRSWASADLLHTSERWKTPALAECKPYFIQVANWKEARHIAIIDAPTMWSASVQANPSRWKSVITAVSVFSPTRFQKQHWRKNRAGGERAEGKVCDCGGWFFGGAVRGWEETMWAHAAGLGFNTNPDSVFYFISFDGRWVNWRNISFQNCCLIYDFSTFMFMFALTETVEALLWCKNWTYLAD